MQTFLPYPSFLDSVRVLDSKRLGKQRVEAMQILNTLETNSRAWANHPAVLMWKGYEDALRLYLSLCIYEWVDRGYNNTMIAPEIKMITPLPPWISEHALHYSHKAALLYKDNGYYVRFGWDVIPGINYFWPVKKGYKNGL